MNYRNPSLTKLARGQKCQFEIQDVCNGDPETTVWCHSNQLYHGKGMSIKAHDCYGAFGCSACHREIDQGQMSRTVKTALWQTAFERSLLVLWEQGLIGVMK